jgi:hypothetical protein
LPDETEESYKWALTETKDLYRRVSESLPTLTRLRPRVISTDCDQALRNAIIAVFPDTPLLLCLWHANKNIQQHCKHKFSTAKAYQDFFESWLCIVRSPNISEYYSQLREFSAAYSRTPETQECVEYIKKTWLKEGRKEALVQAWTNRHTHFGVTVTSRLVLLLLLL